MYYILAHAYFQVLVMRISVVRVPVPVLAGTVRHRIQR